MGDNCLSPLKLPTMTAEEVMAINTAKSPPSSAYCQEPPFKKVRRNTQILDKSLLKNQG